MAEIEVEKQKDKSDTGVKKNGGARPGAGRPAGSQNKETKEKRKAEQEMIQRIINNLEGILNSQLNLAHGVSYLYRIDVSGEGKSKKREHVLVTDPNEIKDYLDSQLDEGEQLDNYYYITTKDPDGKAIDSLIDRAFGKATQKVGGDPENPLVVQIINYGAKDNNNSLPVSTEDLPDAVPPNGEEVQNSGMAQEIGKDQDSIEQPNKNGPVEEGNLLLHPADLPTSETSDLGRSDKTTPAGGDSI